MSGKYTGCMCRATAGHDKGTYYIITDDKNGIRVADGRLKKVGSPKLKNIRHLEIIDYRDEQIADKIRKNRLHDEDVKYSIKKYLNHIKKRQEAEECQKQM